MSWSGIKSDNLFTHIKTIHFVGIGGAGMAGIAEVLLHVGYTITGSDIVKSDTTERLLGLGATIFYGHSQAHLSQADIVVRSSAIVDANVEILSAIEKNIPVISRAQMLAQLMRFRLGIAVAGTHGKTTTTSLLATIFDKAGIDPTFVIGGRLKSIDSHAHLGEGKYLIAEADESDRSFLSLLPVIAVITNIYPDHLTAYDNNFTLLQEAFVQFLQGLPFNGLAILCVDDPVTEGLLTRINRPKICYGFSDKADIRADDVITCGMMQQFTVHYAEKNIAFPVTLNMPGEHNILNALAAIAVAISCDISPDIITSALKAFQGIERRFNVYNNVNIGNSKVSVVDDYGHHPNELTATLKTARKIWPTKRLIWVFQPHRYTRTRDCFDDLCRVLRHADYLVLLDVYSAGEKLIPGADGEALYNTISHNYNIPCTFVRDLDGVIDVLSMIVKNTDIVLMQGAGTIKQCVDDVLSHETNQVVEYG